MLEVLEEPPPRNHFILCTTEPGKLLKTIRTRCSVFNVNKLVKRDLITLVTWVSQQEGAELDPSVVTAIADSAAGSPRQALVILDAIIDLGTVEEMVKVASEYHYSENVVFDLANALLNKVAWAQVAKIIKGLNAKDAEDIRYAILGILERSLLAGGKQADRAAAIMDFFASSFYNTGRPGLTQACWFSLKA
jgi:DNA polymerase-3 subunit gamma/tau